MNQKLWFHEAYFGPPLLLYARLPPFRYSLEWLQQKDSFPKQPSPVLHLWKNIHIVGQSNWAKDLAPKIGSSRLRRMRQRTSKIARLKIARWDIPTVERWTCMRRRIRQKEVRLGFLLFLIFGLRATAPFWPDVILRLSSPTDAGLITRKPSLVRILLNMGRRKELRSPCRTKQESSKCSVSGTARLKEESWFHSSLNQRVSRSREALDRHLLWMTIVDIHHFQTHFSNPGRKDW